MKTVIYYFSGTGNSLKVARDLAAELGGAEIVPIPKAIKEAPIEPQASCVGIVFPVYVWGQPLIVNSFIDKLSLSKNTYVFAIATYGGMPGATLKQTAKQLESKGSRLHAGFGITMPGNYTPMYGAIPEERQNSMFQKEIARIKEIAEIIKNGIEHKPETSNFLANCIFSGIIYKLGAPRLPKSDKSFWVDEKCNSCSICEKVCPVKNIKIIDGKPTWQGRCEQCMACLQWCPKEAIQFGKKTADRKRYRCPETKVSDFITN